MASASKTEMLENLRGMLRDVLRLRTEGVAYAKLSRAHGYLDGYMRVLLETGLFSQKELLALISEERNLHDGPATGIVVEDARSEAPRGVANTAPAASGSRAQHAA
jgi:hypothetical protein